jgi:hypothetical protein
MHQQGGFCAYRLTNSGGNGTVVARPQCVDAAGACVGRRETAES